MHNPLPKDFKMLYVKDSKLLAQPFKYSSLKIGWKVKITREQEPCFIKISEEFLRNYVVEILT